MSHSIPSLQARIERVLDKALSNTNTPERLNQSMRYSTLGAGKRVRALLAYAAGEAVHAPIERLDKVSAALECIHAYSLIHDDLPAMDDDDLRRGKATNHIEFDQPTAILAGDALQTLAFEIINQPDSGLSDKQCRNITYQLSLCAGQIGMVGGQMLDIQATEKEIPLSELEDIHQRKTSALIKASVLCGAMCADNIPDTTLKALEHYADNLGLAFQVVDDVLDIESSTSQLGKTSGADIALGKSTYPSLIGLDKSKQLAQQLYQQAIKSLDTLATTTNNCDLLIELAKLIVRRKY